MDTQQILLERSATLVPAEHDLVWTNLLGQTAQLSHESAGDDPPICEAHQRFPALSKECTSQCCSTSGLAAYPGARHFQVVVVVFSRLPLKQSKSAQRKALAADRAMFD